MWKKREKCNKASWKRFLYLFLSVNEDFKVDEKAELYFARALTGSCGFCRSNKTLKLEANVIHHFFCNHSFYQDEIDKKAAQNSHIH